MSNNKTKEKCYTCSESILDKKTDTMINELENADDKPDDFFNWKVTKQYLDFLQGADIL